MTKSTRGRQAPSGVSQVIMLPVTDNPCMTVTEAPGIKAAYAIWLARLLARITGGRWTGSVADLRSMVTDDGKPVSEYHWQEFCKAMITGGRMTRIEISAPRGRKAFLFAFSDRPGVVPSTGEELMTLFEYRAALVAQTKNSSPRAAVFRPVATCGDAIPSQVATGPGFLGVTVAPSVPSAASAGGRDRREEKTVNRSKAPLSVVGNWEAMVKLAKLPPLERPAKHGALWSTNREVHQALALLRNLDKGVEAVDQVLHLLGMLELPFWMAPTATTLLLSPGWNQERLQELLTPDLSKVKHKNAYLEKVLAATDPGGDYQGTLAGLEVPAPSLQQQIDQLDATAPWDRDLTCEADRFGSGAPQRRERSFDEVKEQMAAQGIALQKTNTPTEAEQNTPAHKGYTLAEIQNMEKATPFPAPKAAPDRLDAGLQLVESIRRRKDETTDPARRRKIQQHEAWLDAVGNRKPRDH